MLHGGDGFAPQVLREHYLWFRKQQGATPPLKIPMTDVVFQKQDGSSGMSAALELIPFSGCQMRAGGISASEYFQQNSI
jgi:hypothetical protein